MKKSENIHYKVERIREILKNRGYDALEINSQVNFSYVTGGRGFIGLASTVSCGSLIITPQKVILVSENIESERLYVEQLNQEPFIEKKACFWDEPEKRTEFIKELKEQYNLASEDDIATELFMLRTVMTSWDSECIQKLSIEAARVLEEICKGLAVGVSDYALAGQISKALWERNIEPITILIGFDERALAYRHPVMHGAVLKNYALVGICARRNGMITSISRDVLIKADALMIEKHRKCACVNAMFLNGLQMGERLGAVYQKAIDVYAQEGFLGEEKLHHQGGLTGFVPRELKAVRQSNHVIRENEVYAFNPTIQGAKVEDTVMTTKDGVRNLTYTGTYNYIDVNIDDKTYKIPTVYVIKE